MNEFDTSNLDEKIEIAACDTLTPAFSKNCFFLKFHEALKNNPNKGHLFFCDLNSVSLLNKFYNRRKVSGYILRNIL